MNIVEFLQTPPGPFFGIERLAGVWRTFDPESHFASTTDRDKITFDVSNGTMLANMGANGALRTVSAYRNGYRATTTGWPGVWMAKDCSTYGSYAFTFEWEGNSTTLAASFDSAGLGSEEPVDWNLRTGLLRNLIPVSTLTDSQGRFSATLLAFAPVSRDGRQRPSAVFYGVLLKNTGNTPLNGIIGAPLCDRAANAATSLRWPARDPFNFEIEWFGYESARTAGVVSGSFDANHGAADRGATFHVPVHLAPGASRWVPAVLRQPGDDVLHVLQTRTVEEWLGETLTYFESLLGRLETPDHPWLAPFHERQILQAVQSLAMAPQTDGSGAFIGGNWGSYEPTRLTWMKDCFYGTLPCAVIDPNLAQQQILWFATYGVRPKGSQFRGGVQHSISLSVSSLMLAGLYYQNTGDAAFFRSHPALRAHWDRIVSELLGGRTDPNVWLFPSDYISDGECGASFHTGSNLCVWHALTSYARLLAEAYGELERAAELIEIAGRVREAIHSHCVMTGRHGPYLNETAHSPGQPDRPFHDGEESDTTLAPVYGFLRFHDPLYLGTMRFAMSPENPNYNPEFFGLRWKGANTTSPGYNKALGAVLSPDDLWGPHAAMTELRRVTDADGSNWWWSFGYEGTPSYQHPIRAFADIGKAAWTAGVFSMLFQAKFLGVEYDAPARRFRWEPDATIGAFTWTGFPRGIDRFTVSRTETTALFGNPNPHTVQLEASLPIGKARTIVVDGRRLAFDEEIDPGGYRRARFRLEVAPDAEVCIEFR